MMHKPFITAGLVVFGVASMAGLAIAAANTVSTTPPPAFVSHVGDGIVDHPATSGGADDPANHDATDDRVTGVDDTSVTTTPRTRPAGTTATTVDDHGGERVRTTPTTSATRQVAGTTVTTVDDHGGDRVGSNSGPGSSSSGPGSGSDDGSGSHSGGDDGPGHT
jgi:hypothetical protein